MKRAPIKPNPVPPRLTGTTKALNALERIEEILSECGQDVPDLCKDIRGEIEDAAHPS